MRKSSMLSLVLAGVLVSSVVPSPYIAMDGVNASDSTLPPSSRIKDLDLDGEFGISDVIHVMQFLSGMVTYQYDYSDMDATADLIVDQADVQAYLAYYNYYRITMGVDAPFTAHSSTQNRFTSEALDYLVYDCSTRTQLRSYTLSAVTTQYQSPRNVFGPDDRVIDWSKSSIVKLVGVDSENKGMSIGTGVVIGAHTILTAAHCLNSKVTGILLFNSSGQSTMTATPVEYHVPDLYYDRRYDPQYRCYDYAIITVAEDLSAYVQLQLGVATDQAINTGKTVTITGYPGGLDTSGDGNVTTEEITENTSSVHNCYTATGPLVNDSGFESSDLFFTRRIRYFVDTSGGNSGGPVYVTSAFRGTTYLTELAVHSNHDPENSGVRVNPDLLHFVYNNNSNFIYQ